MHPGAPVGGFGEGLMVNVLGRDQLIYDGKLPGIEGLGVQAADSGDGIGGGHAIPPGRGACVNTSTREYPITL
jgi:hypothetical protein